MYKKITIGLLISLMIIIFKIMYCRVCELLKINLTYITTKETLNIDNKYNSYIKHKEYIDKILLESCNELYNDNTLKELAYYALKDGKRVRSTIVSSIYEKYKDIDIYNISDANLNNYICSIEYLHASTLILDDIMDGDILRRGEDCVYIKYGIPKAQLIALMLTAQSYKKMYATGIQIADSLPDKMRSNEYSRKYQKVCENIFDNYEKLSIGQYLDLFSNTDDVRLVLHHKTVTLFEITYFLAYSLLHLKDYKEPCINDIKEISNYMGMLFQIADDFTDIEVDKNNGSKYNYILNFGIDYAYMEYHCYKESWFVKSKEMKMSALAIEDIVNFLTERTDKIYNKYRSDN